MSTLGTREAWLKALGEIAEPVDADSMTMTEIRSLCPAASHSVVYRWLMGMIDAGQAKRTWKIVKLPSGQSRRLQSYTIMGDVAVGRVAGKSKGSRKRR